MSCASHVERHVTQRLETQTKLVLPNLSTGRLAGWMGRERPADECCWLAEWAPRLLRALERAGSGQSRGPKVRLRPKRLVGAGEPAEPPTGDATSLAAGSSGRLEMSESEPVAG